MPTHRSITLSLISHYDLRSIPEYTLPPSTSIGISGSSSMIHGDTEKKAYSLAGGSTDSINVYAPTFPNSQFLLKFNAAKPTFPAEYYFFKFFVDGKHFSSWGIGEESDWSGKMVFGLFVNKYDQIERRTLTFGSAANVSSSIEVKVFRCFGRKRDNAHLDCLTEDEGERQKKPTHRENHAAIAQDELVGLLKGREQDMRGVRYACLLSSRLTTLVNVRK
ncbi:MAG: hypothetical protein M1839_000705 [Geoglossum umbratile]|nr:MAG: hypothetical protein M1839_000705 [Geoglossum umbratile]